MACITTSTLFQIQEERRAQSDIKPSSITFLDRSRYAGGESYHLGRRKSRSEVGAPATVLPVAVPRQLGPTRATDLAGGLVHVPSASAAAD
uniref:Uncharacterized protein n=1 Tax=Oryza brachyantha TaxID=4533 RepID=J3MBF8_ORYBR